MRVEFPWVATSVHNHLAYFASLPLNRAMLLVLLVFVRKSSAISRECLLLSMSRSYQRCLYRRAAHGILELLRH
jgi:hypothetical protein